MTEKLTLVEARVRETATGVHGSVEKIVEDVGEIVEDVKGTVDTTLVAVRQGVAGTHAAVGAMGEQVKGTIGETVATGKRTVYLPSQTAHHPWPLVGGAVRVGSMLGRRGSGPRPADGPTAERATEADKAGSPRLACIVRSSAAPARARERYAASHKAVSQRDVGGDHRYAS